MSTRQITECDRCHSEIKGPVKVHVEVRVPGEGISSDLCEPCASDLGAFLDGRDLDEPP